MTIVNSVSLIGRVGRDPEIRTTRGGTKVVEFSVATTERWKKHGEKKERTDWHRITAFGDGLAGLFEKHVKKGSLIAVKGKLQTERWTDENGKNHYITSVILDFNGEVELLGRAPSNDNSEPPAGEPNLPDDKAEELASRSAGEAA